MRRHGVVDSASGLLPFGHLGWAYRDREEFRARAREYLIDGLNAGQWIEYVGEGETADLRRELLGFTDVEDVVAAGRVGVTTVGDFYEYVPGGGGVVDPYASVAARAAATEKVLDAGYAGFRAVVDATAVARTSSQRAAFACFEYLIDQQMSVLPVSTICAYDEYQLGAAATSELACLHPYTSPSASQFRLYADDGAAFVLAGELDLSCRQPWDSTLERILPLTASAELVVDGRGLSFTDHTSLVLLDKALEKRGMTGVLRTSNRSARRIAELIDFPHLRVEPTR
jgi:anti-anti-sigma regulatory factor